ncbi:MAG: hypothetical protein AAFR59_20435, partial [Bacteroidota bacterium]
HLLRDAIIQKLDIAVDASHISQFSIYNDFGPLDSTQPFQPFGVVPTSGSSFYVGNVEAFSKPLSSLDLHVEWMDVPQNTYGIEGYYSTYNIDFEAYKETQKKTDSPQAQVDATNLPSMGKFKDDTYNLKMSYLNDYRWNAPSTPKPLFEYAGINPKIRTERALKFEHLPIQIDPKVWKQQGITAPRLEEDPPWGFIKLELSAPPEAFGHKIYPLALAEAVRFNAVKANAKTPVPLPLEPYTPT